MTSRIAETIVELNNGALTHFLNGDYDQAIVSLRMAYEIFEAHRREPSSSDMAQDSTSIAYGAANTRCPPPSAVPQQTSTCSGDDCMEEDECETTTSTPTPSSSSLSQGLPPVTSPTDSDMDFSTIASGKSLRSLLRVEPTCSFASSPSTAYSMYNRALVLSIDPADNDEDGDGESSLLVRHRHRTSAIILYNLALVHHNIGIHLGVSAAIWQALKLYEMALETIDKGSSLVDVEKLLLALLNNMGNIHTHLFNFANSEACMNNLRVVLAASSSTMTLDEDYVFFFLNALFQGKELCFAPAA